MRFHAQATAVRRTLEVRAVRRGQELSVEDDRAILGTRQFSDTDGISPKHLGGNLGWTIAVTKNDDIGAGDPAQQSFELAVCRDHDEVSG